MRFSDSTTKLPAREIPLWFWAAGFADFLWNTAGPGGIPPGLISAFGLFAATAVSVAGNRARWQAEWKNHGQSLFVRFRNAPVPSALLWSCLALLLCSLALGLFSSLRPPFLPQEYDAVNYQMGIPRQLLLRHSLRWIDWSVADLWPMALQWGMAPLSNAFSTVNKLPQFLFTLGLAACLFRLPRQLGASGAAAWIPLFAVMGAHGVMIQIGTGMMDLPLLYLLLLCVSALLDARWCVAALSLAVFTASKSFHLFLVAPLVTGGTLWAFFGKSKIPMRPLVGRFLSVLLLAAGLLLARSAVVSIRSAGTPLFPFASCRAAQGSLCEGNSREVLSFVESELISTRDKYGNGRTPKAFLAHLWRVAIPTQGVNNEFDYPLGLPWLLFVVLLGFSFARGLPRSPLLWASLVLWGLWWMNAHQSRWLYPTLAFGFLGTLELQRRAELTLLFALFLSSTLSLASQVRSLTPSLHLMSKELQSQEEAKVKWAPDGKLATHELLYVNRPALDYVPGTKSVWVLR